MSKILEFEFEDGGTVRIETTRSLEELGAQPAAISELAVKAGKTFEDALRVIQPTSKAILKMMRDIGPSEIGVEFGVAVSTDAGVVIKAGTDVNFKVSLKWAQGDADES